MISCSISIPDTTVKAPGYKESEIGIHLKKEMAVYFFQRNILSFGQARQLAEMPVWDFPELLRERKIPLYYDTAEYEQDLKIIQDTQ